MLLITDGITGGSCLESNGSGDITGVNLVKLVSLVGMHLKDTANTLFFILCCIQYIGTGVHCTGIHTEECQFTNERVGHDLERKSRERLVVGGVTHDLVAIHVNAFDGRDVKGRRHELDHSIQKLLNALVSVSSTAAYRDRLAFAGSLTENLFQFFNGRLLAIQIHHHQIVIQLADLLNQLGSVKLCIVLHIFRNVSYRDIIALIIVVDVSLHLKQVDDSLELVFLTDREL